MARIPTNRSPGDEELALRASRGCAASFEELMRRYQAPVLHFLQHRGRLSDAEDLLQETFVRAYANLDRYRPRWRFSTWLFTIARRISINHGRTVRPVSDDDAARQAASSAPGPVEAAAEAESRRYLWAIADRVLAEEERTALWLHYVEGMPAREIATVLDRSWVSVKTMMFRARKKLLPLVKHLAPEGTGPRTAEAAGREEQVEACHE
jgi:RNA polymerase sigma-70 factor (ECF subfamily)